MLYSSDPSWFHYKGENEVRIIACLKVRDEKGGKMEEIQPGGESLKDVIMKCKQIRLLYWLQMKIRKELCMRSLLSVCVWLAQKDLFQGWLYSTRYGWNPPCPCDWGQKSQRWRDRIKESLWRWDAEIFSWQSLSALLILLDDPLCVKSSAIFLLRPSLQIYYLSWTISQFIRRAMTMVISSRYIVAS